MLTIDFLFVNGLMREAIIDRVVRGPIGGDERPGQEIGARKQDIVKLAGWPLGCCALEVLARGQLGGAQDGGVGVVLVHCGGDLGRRCRKSRGGSVRLSYWRGHVGASDSLTGLDAGIVVVISQA